MSSSIIITLRKMRERVCVCVKRVFDLGLWPPAVDKEREEELVLPIFLEKGEDLYQVKSK